jgi:tetratricopeptide (TPR) repeat protein
VREAILCFERCLAIGERVHGPDHPEVAVALDNLARAYRVEGDAARALPMLERALAIKERAFGLDHVHLTETLNNLALCCTALDRPGPAKTLFERSLNICNAQLGPDHPETSNVMVSLSALAALAMQPQPCGACQTVGAPGATRCSQCLSVWYCNRECQKAAWKAHRPQCKKVE